MPNSFILPAPSRRTLLTLSASALLSLPALRAARAESDADNLISKARITLDDVRKDKEFGNAKVLLKTARAVLIVPELFKGGFFLGGEGGTGVFMIRRGGQWSEPAFYTLASASFGLQIGAELSELVLIIISDKGQKAFMSDQFKIGAEAGIAVVTLGSNAEAATSGNGAADIYVWSSSSGAYAGITLNGSIIKPRMEYNKDFYGRPASSEEIVDQNAVFNPKADGLRRTLTDMS